MVRTCMLRKTQRCMLPSHSASRASVWRRTHSWYNREIRTPREKREVAVHHLLTWHPHLSPFVRPRGVRFVCLRHHIWEQRGVTSGGVKVDRLIHAGRAGRAVIPDTASHMTWHGLTTSSWRRLTEGGRSPHLSPTNNVVPHLRDLNCRYPHHPVALGAPRLTATHQR